ncbi:MAG: type IV pilus biogenesis/stability protein PilW [Pseudomonadota bacterium]|nr:type IV pilus biogenesis/stability protein PilW [Pseudomonadota bacterium]
MRRLFAALLLAAAGCASQSTLETRPVTDSGGADNRRRAEVHTALAGEYYARGNFAVALAEARLALKDDPTYYPAHNVQALVFMELREDVMARASFDQALRISPNNPEVLNNFGWFLCLRSETARGLEMMLRAASDTQYTSPEKAWLSAGLCLRRVGRNNEAEDAFRRAILIRPDLIGALYNLALINFERGEMRDAENYLMRYTRLSAPSIEALVLGVRIARAKDDKVAEDSFMQQLRRRYPDSPQMRELETAR